jgi:hypothetical protein
MPSKPPDLMTSAEASELIGRRIEPYHRENRRNRIIPAMRAGSGPRSPLLFHRSDVEKLRDEIVAQLNDQLSRVKRAS